MTFYANIQAASALEMRIPLDPDAVLVRAMDVLVSILLLLCLAPLLVMLAVLVYVADPGPVLFGHRRIGRDGRTFWCLKFRTMVRDAEARLTTLINEDEEARVEWLRDHKLRKDPRVTRIGALMRRSSLDELPQLLNVLRGTMSLVGPRPIVQDEVYRYGRYFIDYCRVKPGITGLWQISGRNDVSYRRRIALDVAYIRSKCLMLDMRILALTLPSILLARGSY